MTASAWPVGFDFAVSWSAGPSSGLRNQFWMSLTGRTEGSISVQRGKTYELDQVQPGSMQLTLRNDDGIFDPSNAASPYAGQILPYRLFRARAQYPVTANMLSPDQATAFYATKGAGGAGSTLPVDVATLQQSVSIVNVGTKNHYRCDLPAGQSDTGVDVFGPSIVPGATYTFQCEISSTLAGQLAEVKILWANAAGQAASNPGATSAAVAPSTTGTLFTVTSTAPADAAGVLLVAQSTTTVAPSHCSLDFWNLQFEQAASASAYGDPGTWYPMFTGYIERWPQSWSSGGNYGVSQLTVVDLFAFLANRGLQWPYYMDMLALSPQVFYPLDESKGATEWEDLTRQRSAAVPHSYPHSVTGKLTAGSSVTGATATPQGLPGPVVTFSNPQSVNPIDGTALDVTGGGGEPGGSGWSTTFAFRTSTGPAAGAYVMLWESTPDAVQTVYELVIGSPQMFYPSGAGTNGALGIQVYRGGVIAPPTVNTWSFAQVTSGSVVDGDWHHVVVTMASDGLTLKVYVDGVLNYTLTHGSDMRSAFTPAGFEVLGLDISPGNGTANGGLAGDLACFAVFDTELTASQVVDLNFSFVEAWGTYSTFYETSDARYQRILNWIGNAAPTRISSGDSVKYGPATDFQGGSSPTGALAALQAIVDSECGQHFVAADGTLVFQARSARYNLAPVVSFGEHAGEVAYQQARTDFDPTRVANDVTATAQNQLAAAASTSRVVDAASQTDYGVVTMSRTVNTVDPAELQAVAEGLLYQNRQPLQRLEALPVNVAANPSYWTTLLGLDLGACVKVTRRPSNAPAITVTGFLEQIRWSLNDKGQAVWTGQVSNNNGHLFAQLNSSTYGLLDSTAILGF